MGRYPRISDAPERHDEHGNKQCRNCWKNVSTGRRHYCSEQCMREYNRNHTWHFVRKDVLRRDQYRCAICEQRHKKASLDVDHIIPVHKGGPFFDKRNLRTLCKECHKRKNRLDRNSQA